ncbi:MULTISPECIES: DNA-3-methyladenine glycosylase I [Lysinibacillus]|uniref:DNA-3-methyladenine glycosylase I n=1 Tax=Lysinibacillus TaxID=400634 RepID=UPI00088EBAFC|nr:MULTISPECIES: DNA-3-methyladenine glycosylase I [Lysinibacillus]MCG7435938.1 DNA-3-methyladenine glycosylase I [Lysinibacillus fusiformis]MED4672425.1 DNA-3-methyladenine glycosylase I [Lysinibacillus fusiformis]NOG30491.1 DNA-3-methyladenine glycosylase I [Lysinibacillus fusiformis]QAS55590.1 DNA-3-methyladenine glycosylase I [Lysinibacillus sphaericus]RDV26880.1 DNA-3-methyladenine glycosylase I [Lysinibacillus fusiformis]
MKRCSWVKLDQPLYVDYHDKEWGVPVYDDQHLFEMLCLEGAQAGLSWWTILQKREGYREAFDHFDAKKIILYSEDKLLELQQDTRIVRNKLKIASVVTNAKAFLQIQEKYDSFSEYIWGFVDHQPIINEWPSMAEVPVTTDRSDRMSKQLKKDGFKFVGSTICYSFMQAVGMVNDHITDCCCRQQGLAHEH